MVPVTAINITTTENSCVASSRLLFDKTSFYNIGKRDSFHFLH